MKPRFAAVALLALTTAGCGGEPEANEAANASTPAPTPKPTVDARLQAAIRAAFPRGTKGEGKQPRSFADHRLVDAPFGPVLISYGAVEDAGENVPGIVAIRYLAAEGDGFAVRRAWPEAIRLGSMGVLGGWSVTDKLVDGLVVYAEGTTQAAGVRCGRARLVALTPAGPADLGTIQTGYERYDGKGDRIQGRIGEIVKGQGFTMDYAGTRSFAERYVLRGGRFVRESNASALPTC